MDQPVFIQVAPPWFVRFARRKWWVSGAFAAVVVAGFAAVLEVHHFTAAHMPKGWTWAQAVVAFSVVVWLYNMSWSVLWAFAMRWEWREAHRHRIWELETAGGRLAKFNAAMVEAMEDVGIDPKRLSAPSLH